MFTLAWTFLPDLTAYRTGLIIVGRARCIAMVIMVAVLGWFNLTVLPDWLGLDRTGLTVSPVKIAGSVLIFLIRTIDQRAPVRHGTDRSTAAGLLRLHVGWRVHPREGRGPVL